MSLKKVVMGCKDGQDFPPIRGTWKSMSYLGGREIPMAGAMLVWHSPRILEKEARILWNSSFWRARNENHTHHVPSHRPASSYSHVPTWTHPLCGRWAWHKCGSDDHPPYQASHHEVVMVESTELAWEGNHPTDPSENTADPWSAGAVSVTQLIRRYLSHQSHKPLLQVKSPIVCVDDTVENHVDSSVLHGLDRSWQVSLDVTRKKNA